MKEEGGDGGDRNSGLQWPSVKEGVRHGRGKLEF